MNTTFNNITTRTCTARSCCCILACMWRLILVLCTFGPSSYLFWDRSVSTVVGRRCWYYAIRLSHFRNTIVVIRSRICPHQQYSNIGGTSHFKEDSVVVSSTRFYQYVERPYDSIVEKFKSWGLVHLWTISFPQANLPWGPPLVSRRHPHPLYLWQPWVLVLGQLPASFLTSNSTCFALLARNSNFNVCSSYLCMKWESLYCFNFKSSLSYVSPVSFFF